MRHLCLGLSLTMLVAFTAAGCKTLRPKRSYPADPLFASKEPVQKTTGPAGAIVVASAAPGPIAPGFPQTLLASGPGKNGVPGQPLGIARQPVQALPAVRSRPLPSATTYGHAADYRWLEGVLEKDIHGRMGLRYCDPTEEDRWGGMVWLDSDPRLAQFRDGDWVRVEGVLLSILHPQTQELAQPPRYRIIEITRQSS